MLEISYRQIFKMALPLMLSSFTQSIVMLTDASFLARIGHLEFDASGNGGLLYITAYMALVGLGDASQIFMARKIGEGKGNERTSIFNNTIFALLFFSIILFTFLQFIMPELLYGYSTNKLLASAQIDFIGIRSYALICAVITLSVQAYFVSEGKTNIVLISALIMAISNIILDYCMIFGEFGFPKLGLKGAALASTIAEALAALFLLICFSIKKDGVFKETIKNFKPNLEIIKTLFKLGAPLMLQGFMALASWVIFFTWIEQRGSFELTVSQNVRAMYFLVFVPIQGFAATTKTYISQYMGAKQFDKLTLIQKRIQIMTVAFLILIFHGAILYPEALISIVNPNQSYIPLTTEILRMIFGSILIYAIVSVKYQTINGSGNTRASFVIELLCLTGYLTGAFLLLKVYNASIFWVWTVEYIYFGSLGLYSILYLRLFNWKSKII